MEVAHLTVTDRQKRIIASAILWIGVAKACLDWYGRWQAALDLRSRIPLLFARPWISPLVIVLGFLGLWWVTRDPTIVPGLLDAHGNAYRKAEHPVIKYGLITVAIAVLFVGVSVLIWSGFRRSNRDLAQTGVRRTDAVVTPPASSNPMLSGRPTAASPSRHASAKTLPHVKSVPPDLRPAPAAKERSAEQSPARPVPTPGFSVNPSVPQEPVNQELENVVREVSSLSNDWRERCTMIENSDLRQYWVSDKPVPSDVRLRVANALAEANSIVSEQFNGQLPAIEKAHDDALAFMQRPGPKQLTPNEVLADQGKFQQAISSARQGPRIEELEANKVNQFRFAGLYSYLLSLQTKLGDYPQS